MNQIMRQQHRSSKEKNGIFIVWREREERGRSRGGTADMTQLRQLQVGFIHSRDFPPPTGAPAASPVSNIHR